jgi:muconolactone delta-isomerase
MPTYETTRQFARDYQSLTEDQRAAFRAAVRKFVEDLERGGAFRRSLRVKGVQGAAGIFEMTWADNGRATFQYGNPIRRGEVHVIWRRCGTHEVFSAP